jgi:hypothetical protein
MTYLKHENIEKYRSTSEEIFPVPENCFCKNSIFYTRQS